MNSKSFAFILNLLIVTVITSPISHDNGVNTKSLGVDSIIKNASNEALKEKTASGKVLPGANKFEPGVKAQEEESDEIKDSEASAKINKRDDKEPKANVDSKASPKKTDALKKEEKSEAPSAKSVPESNPDAKKEAKEKSSTEEAKPRLAKRDDANPLEKEVKEAIPKVENKVDNKEAASKSPEKPAKKEVDVKNVAKDKEAKLKSDPIAPAAKDAKSSEAKPSTPKESK